MQPRSIVMLAAMVSLAAASVWGNLGQWSKLDSMAGQLTELERAVRRLEAAGAPPMQQTVNFPGLCREPSDPICNEPSGLRAESAVKPVVPTASLDPQIAAAEVAHGWQMQLEAESRDGGWATATELQLTHSIEALGKGKYTILALACRSTLCRADVRLEDPREGSRLGQVANPAEGLLGAVSVFPNGTEAVVFYKGP